MHKKQFFILSLLLLMVPACGKKRICPVHPATAVEPLQAPLPTADECAPCTTPMPNAQDGDVDAFVLEESENPFSAAPTSQATATEEDLTLVNAEAPQGDSHSDSAKYGLKNVYFDFDHYDIRPDQQAVLEHNAGVVKDLADKNYDISVEGHACNFAGDTQYNMALSEDRAKSVADYFVQNGVDKKRVSTTGHGSTRPLVASGNKEQQAPNRRVEIYAYPAKSN